MARRSKKDGRGGRREGAGRKLQYGVNRTVRFSPADIKKVERAAKREGISFAQLIRDAVAAHLGQRPS